MITANSALGWKSIAELLRVSNKEKLLQKEMECRDRAPYWAWAMLQSPEFCACCSKESL